MKIIGYLLLLAWASSVSALPIPPKPEKCPGVTAIAQTSFLTVSKLFDDNYAAVQLSQYDTVDIWVFIIAGIVAASAQDALTQAAALLNSLTLLAGPNYSAPGNIWGCTYQVDGGHPAVALTPISLQDLSIMRLLEKFPGEPR